MPKFNLKNIKKIANHVEEVADDTGITNIVETGANAAAAAVITQINNDIQTGNHTGLSTIFNGAMNSAGTAMQTQVEQKISNATGINEETIKYIESSLAANYDNHISDITNESHSGHNEVTGHSTEMYGCCTIS